MKELFILLVNCLCDYRCVFCSRGLEDHQAALKNYLKFFDYKKELLSIQYIIFEGYRRQKFKLIKLGGNEPLNHPKIINIVEFSRRTGYEKILIHTSGVRFSDLEFTKRISDAGLTNVYLPVYGANDKIHDKIVRLKGSFYLVMKAINNLKKFNINVDLHTLILKQNLMEIYAIKRKFHNIGLRLPFPDPNRPLAYKEICVRLSDIPAKIKEALKLGIPCVLNKSLGDVDFHENEEVKFGPDSPNETTENRSGVDKKIKPRKCKSCRFFESCEGIYSSYLEIYGDGEFNPR